MTRLIAALFLVLSWLRETIPVPSRRSRSHGVEGDEHEFAWNEYPGL
jgi:hypothetical protein